ncbi:MAG: hypothetical protein K2K14_01460, partial [Ruminococcus sp.]|nr:hypothetical protein [Ruminococcus sp.]
ALRRQRQMFICDRNGNDLVQAGLKGAEIGVAFQELLNLVIEEKLPNEHDILLNYIKQRCNK